MKKRFYVVEVLGKEIKFDDLGCALVFVKAFKYSDCSCVEVFEVDNTCFNVEGKLDSWFFIPYNSFEDYDKNIEELKAYRLNYKDED